MTSAGVLAVEARALMGGGSGRARCRTSGGERLSAVAGCVVTCSKLTRISEQCHRRGTVDDGGVGKLAGPLCFLVHWMASFRQGRCHRGPCVGGVCCCVAVFGWCRLEGHFVSSRLVSFRFVLFRFVQCPFREGVVYMRSREPVLSDVALPAIVFRAAWWFSRVDNARWIVCKPFMSKLARFCCWPWHAERLVKLRSTG